MGGVGSGWFERRSNKMKTDDYPSIDVRRLGCNPRLDGYVILAGGVLAELEWRPCHLGGYRPYFRCPQCKERCCLLYSYQVKGKGASNYGCQKCLGMFHPVENEGKLERAMRRSNKTFNRQGYDPTRPQGKPLWMRWPTWRRLSKHATESIMARFEYHAQVVRLLDYLEQPRPSTSHACYFDPRRRRLPNL